jgi:hypothetical protein
MGLVLCIFCTQTVLRDIDAMKKEGHTAVEHAKINFE